jgi:hypothetical protein
LFRNVNYLHFQLEGKPMATLSTIRPRLPSDYQTCVVFISEYNARRELDMIKPNMYVKKARQKKEKTTAKTERNKKVTVSLEQLAMLQKLGLV